MTPELTKFTVCDATTGAVIRWGETSGDPELQANAGEAVIPDVQLDPRKQAVDPQTKAVIAWEPPKPPLSALKAAAKAATAQRRWEIETGGVDIAGASVDTDDRSKLLLSSAAESARDDANFTATWKTADGSWMPLDAKSILAVYGAVFDHVRACFAREAELDALIDKAASADDVAWLDPQIKAFWPAP